MRDLRRKTVKILNISVDSTSLNKVLRYVRFRLSKFSISNGEASFKKFYIVTPNPEQVMRAQTDGVFARILNSADISVPDGIGLVAAYKFLQLPKAKNLVLKLILYFAQGLGVGFSVLFDKQWLTRELKLIHGRELFLELIRLANKKGWKVFLIGDRQRSAQKASEILQQNYKKVRIVAESGPILDEDANPLGIEDAKIEEKVVAAINKFSPHLLFIGFGAPRQEKWLYRWLPKLKIGGAMVVGGTFDYISGKKKVPPRWVEEAGLEWLWRLSIRDQNAKRIIKAFPQFPLRIFWQKMTLK